jgi:dTDP-glucose 4,6-dehydratase
VEHLLATTDWQLVVLDSLTYAGRVDRLTDAQGFDPDRVHILWHDLRGKIHLHLDEQLGDIDAALHLAAESHVDRSIADPVPFVINNVMGTLNLLEWARTRQLSHFVQISTDEVYGPAPAGVRHREWDPVIPSNPYSASKAAQEAIATAYWRTYRIPVVISNTMNLIGERQHPEKFVPLVIKHVLTGQEVGLHGQLVPLGAGHAAGKWEPSSRHWLHARNHADALRWILQETTPGMFPEADRPDRWHVAGEERDVLQMAELIADAAGKSLRFRFVDFHSSRPGHDPRYALDPSKIHEAGWAPPVPLQESLERMVQWTVKHREQWL